MNDTRETKGTILVVDDDAPLLANVLAVLTRPDLEETA